MWERKNNIRVNKKSRSRKIVNKWKMIKTAYDFEFPKELIAQKPAKPRDSARLLVYDRKLKKTAWDTFAHLPKYLPPRSVLVLNRTKVVPARLAVTKESGGRARLLYVRTAGRELVFLSDRKLAAGSRVRVNQGIYFEVAGQAGSEYDLRPSFPVARIFRVLEKYGQTPIPPYIKNSPLKEKDLRREYQAVFAKTKGSVAAPTASLHFTPALLAKLRRAGHEVRFVTLHVNLGTFAPLTAENLRTGKLHAEFYEMDAATARALTRARTEGRPIIPVGTTVLRTLESAADARGRLRKLSGETRLFIRPGYEFRFTDRLVTNFHVPGSSLLLLTEALLGRKTLENAYKQAIRRRFRLFSFGDGMLIL